MRKISEYEIITVLRKTQ